MNASHSSAAGPRRSSTIAPPRLNPQRAAFAGAIGSTIEWYDFFLYGTASALVFGNVFFPAENAFVSQLLAFVSFGVAFLARPLGGIVFGFLGDRFGRKPVLVATLLVMGLSTGAVGLVPSYASIGITAPIIVVLLRILQGLSVGGEYGGAVLMAVEHAGPKNKSFYGSWIQAGSPAGLVLCNSVFLLSVLAFPHSEWAWRIPFLISFVLVAIGLYIRTRISESPEFKAAQEQQEIKKNPLSTVLREAKLRTVLVSLAYVGAGVSVYIVATYALSFGTGSVGYSIQNMLLLVIVGQIAAFVAMLVFGKLGDRVPYHKVFIIGCVLLGLCSVPWMLGMQSQSLLLAGLGYVLIAVPYAAVYGSMAVFFATTFDTSIGYTGLSTGYQVGTVISSAVAPTIALSLLEVTGSVWSIVAYMLLSCLVSAVAAVALQRQKTKHVPRTPAAAAGAET